MNPTTFDLRGYEYLGSRAGTDVYRLAVPDGYMYVTLYRESVSTCFVPYVSGRRNEWMGPK